MRTKSQRGAVAGLDALMFGTLILLAGTLAVIHLWSIVETRTALDTAAREYLRSYTAARSGPDAVEAGGRAVDEVLRQRRTPLHDLRVRPPDPLLFGPCESATVHLSARISGVRLPFLADIGSTTVEVTATELVPAHRELLAGPAHDRRSTPCTG